MSKLIRVFKYRRVSTIHQVQDGDSLQDQDDILDKYIEEHPDMICVGSFFDGGVSGRKTERDGFQELMEHVKNNECDLIIFTRLDRWFRNLRHSLNTNAILEQHNVHWIAVEQQYYETRTAAGRAFFANSMAFAQFLAENNAETIIEHNKAKVARGEVLTGSVGIGFTIDENKHLKANEDAHIVVELFDYFEQCYSLTKTTKWLETTYNIVRDRRSIKRMLSDIKYTGRYRDNPNFCKPIISIEQFERIQPFLIHSVKCNAKRTYIFSGLIKCKNCGRNFIGQTTSDKYQYKIYRCYANRMKKNCDNYHLCSEMKVEKYLLKNVMIELQKYIVDYEVNQEPVTDNSKKIDSLNEKIKKLKILYINDLISLEELTKDKNHYESEIKKLESKKSPVKDLSILKEFLKLDLNNIYNKLTDEEKRALWRSIIKEIIFQDKEHIEIVFI